MILVSENVITLVVFYTFVSFGAIYSLPYLDSYSASFSAREIFS